MMANDKYLIHKCARHLIQFKQFRIRRVANKVNTKKNIKLCTVYNIWDNKQQHLKNKIRRQTATLQ